MKTLKILAFISSLAMLLVTSCTKDFEEINKDPNQSVEVLTGYMITYAQKNTMDNLRDEWFGGRATQLVVQHWGQRNYSDEDRYLFRTSVNNAAWRAYYLSMANLEKVIDLNTNEATKVDAQKSGPNNHQIAVSKILQVYIMSIITDTWGDVPYSECFNTEIPKAKYDSQQDIYAQMIATLKEAADLIVPVDDTDEDDVKVGDVVYGGKMDKWKKFANSLRLRLALRVRHKNPAYFNEVIALPASSFFESNADNAVFTYKAEAPNQGPIYQAFFVDARNDFTISKTLNEILAGRNDSLNVANTNPFVGILDPRIDVFSYANTEGEYIGMPYGMLDSYTKQFAAKCPDYTIAPSVVHEPDFGYVYMDYAEVCFIMSEANNWDQNWYEAGIRASMEFWGVATADIDAYITAVPAANEENVMTQKYIAFYMQPEQAWFEYRRKGYPNMLLNPGEISHRVYDNSGNATDLVFESLDGTDIPRRMIYPVEEQTINSVNYTNAVAAQGLDALDTRVWWDKP